MYNKKGPAGKSFNKGNTSKAVIRFDKAFISNKGDKKNKVIKSKEDKHA